MDLLVEPMGHFGFTKDDMQVSYNTLFTNGNLGCTAILFVLNNTLPHVPADKHRVLCFAFGPGVTVEWALLTRAPRQ